MQVVIDGEQSLQAEECREISATSDLQPPDMVAKKILSDFEVHKFTILFVQLYVCYYNVQASKIFLVSITLTF